MAKIANHKDIGLFIGYSFIVIFLISLLLGYGGNDYGGGENEW